ncbi:VapE domain-containing protein [Rhodanobacter soli]
MSSDIADFLKRFRPDGIHVLTSIIPDGKTETKSFTDSAEAEAWALAQNGKKRNVYFHVNPTLCALDNKASKADIANVDFLHVDIDPRTGEDKADEQARILHLLTTELPPGIPEPSLIVFSGNGYQALWRLAEPIAIDGDIAKATEAERYNRQLEKVFQADNCHNVDRLLRLPGTINYPNKKKRAKGRVAANAEVHSWHDSAPHPLSAFTLASTTTDKARSTSPKRAAPVGLGVGGPMGTTELEAWAAENRKTITDKTLALIATGDAGEYGGDRSKMVFRVSGDLLRAGVPDEMIVAALTDPNNPVSAHVRDQKGNIAKYAQRQIDRARASMAPQWDRMNKAGEPLPSYWNTRIALQLMDVECRYDKFRDRYLVGAYELQEFTGEFSDHAERILRDEVIRRCGFDPGEINTSHAVRSLCTENRFDSLLDHLEALPTWDEIPRLDTWLIDYCGVEDSPYTRAAGATWLLGAVVRAFEPGKKFDYMPVLMGGQGVGKSTALRIIATDDFFSDASFLGARDSREVLEVTRGAWILECAELDGMGKRDVSALKAAIARQTDTGRPAYARNAVAVARRYVLAGTTNEERFLQDPTENRRFWPIAVGMINLNGLREARDQLIAEALAQYRTGHYQLTLQGDAALGACEAQAQRRVVDLGFVERLENLSPDGKRDGRWVVTTDTVYQRLDIPNKDRCGNVPHKVREAMGALGWAPVRGSVRWDGVKQRIYEWMGVGKPGEDAPF